MVSLQVRISRNDAWVNDDPGVVSYMSPVSLMLIGTSNTSAVEELCTPEPIEGAQFNLYKIGEWDGSQGKYVPVAPFDKVIGTSNTSAVEELCTPEPIEGAQFNLYKIGEWDGSQGKYVPVAPFDKDPFDQIGGTDDGGSAIGIVDIMGAGADQLRQLSTTLSFTIKQLGQSGNPFDQIGGTDDGGSAIGIVDIMGAGADQLRQLSTTLSFTIKQLGQSGKGIEPAAQTMTNAEAIGIVDIMGAGADQLRQLSTTLSFTIKQLGQSGKGIEPAAQTMTNAEGVARFDGLVRGLYLVDAPIHQIQSTTAQGKTQIDEYVISSSLVALPNVNSDSPMDVAITAKATHSKGIDPIHVEKVWKNDDPATRPKSIKVSLWMEGEDTPIGSAELSAENDWKHVRLAVLNSRRRTTGSMCGTTCQSATAISLLKTMCRTDTMCSSTKTSSIRRRRTSPSRIRSRNSPSPR